MGSFHSRTDEQKEKRKVERLVGKGFVLPPSDSSSTNNQRKASASTSNPSSSKTKSSTTKPASSSTKSGTNQKIAHKPVIQNYNHPALKGQDHVKLVGPDADPSKNKAWMGDVKGLPLWGPGVLPAMAPASEVGKGQQRQKEGRERIEREKAKVKK